MIFIVHISRDPNEESKTDIDSATRARRAGCAERGSAPKASRRQIKIGSRPSRGFEAEPGEGSDPARCPVTPIGPILGIAVVTSAARE
jgi:hypothetical protein